MRILDKIVNHLKIEIEVLSESVPIFELEKTKGFDRKCKSLKESIQNSKSGIICEFKRRSPSNENINYTSNIKEVVKGYEKAGAVGVSILTNKKFDNDANNVINYINLLK